jgi:hypothetical protein
MIEVLVSLSKYGKNLSKVLDSGKKPTSDDTVIFWADG